MEIGAKIEVKFGLLRYGISDLGIIGMVMRILNCMKMRMEIFMRSDMEIA